MKIHGSKSQVSITFVFEKIEKKTEDINLYVYVDT